MTGKAARSGKSEKTVDKPEKDCYTDTAIKQSRTLARSHLRIPFQRVNRRNPLRRVEYAV